MLDTKRLIPSLLLCQRITTFWDETGAPLRWAACNLSDISFGLEKLRLVFGIFFYEFGDGYLRSYGPEQVRWMFPVRTYAEQGIIAAGSSDSPVTMVNLWWGMWEALTRVTMNGQSAGIEERIGLFDAVRMYTINGAYASFEEKVKGSLEPGKLADLIVLDRDLIGSRPEEIRDAAVALTMIGDTVPARSPDLLHSLNRRVKVPLH